MLRSVSESEAGLASSVAAATAFDPNVVFSAQRLGALDVLRKAYVAQEVPLLRAALDPPVAGLRAVAHDARPHVEELAQFVCHGGRHEAFGRLGCEHRADERCELVIFGSASKLGTDSVQDFDSGSAGRKRLAQAILVAVAEHEIEESHAQRKDVRCGRWSRLGCEVERCATLDCSLGCLHRAHTQIKVAQRGRGVGGIAVEDNILWLEVSMQHAVRVQKANRLRHLLCRAEPGRAILVLAPLAHVAARVVGRLHDDDIASILGEEGALHAHDPRMAQPARRRDGSLHALEVVHAIVLEDLGIAIPRHALDGWLARDVLEVSVALVATIVHEKSGVAQQYLDVVARAACSIQLRVGIAWSPNDALRADEYLGEVEWDAQILPKHRLVPRPGRSAQLSDLRYHLVPPQQDGGQAFLRILVCGACSL
mmetsp:Transcript_9547/g.29051  ORF Transcript_9547/g.29051 Transcript_9547/m.29051 type:complete len:425 (+) Transcript_9547:1255-2529(+)